MASLLGLGVVVMIAADAVVGSRLLLLARRTRRLPEFALGSSVLLLGGVGYPLAIAARQGLGGAEAATGLLAAALAMQNLAGFAMAVAVWCTFRPGSAAARWATALLASMLLASWLGQALFAGFPPAAGGSASYWLGFAGRVLPFLWSAAESWRYYGLLRKRLAIGLAEPVVTDRFRLWAICSSAVTLAFGAFAFAALQGLDVSSEPGVLAVTSLAGLVSGVTLWLAFLAPHWYLRRFESVPSH
jgi:hypothetical protein